MNIPIVILFNGVLAHRKEGEVYIDRDNLENEFAPVAKQEPQSMVPIILVFIAAFYIYMYYLRKYLVLAIDHVRVHWFGLTIE